MELLGALLAIWFVLGALFERADPRNFAMADRKRKEFIQSTQRRR